MSTSSLNKEGEVETSCVSTLNFRKVSSSSFYLFNMCNSGVPYAFSIHMRPTKPIIASLPWSISVKAVNGPQFASAGRKFLLLSGTIVPTTTSAMIARTTTSYATSAVHVSWSCSITVPFPSISASSASMKPSIASRPLRSSGMEPEKDIDSRKVVSIVRVFASAAA